MVEGTPALGGGGAGCFLRADRLYKESGGNPFFLEQLARAVERNGGAVTAQGGEQLLGGIDVPAGVAALLAEELGELRSTARLVIWGAAVSGDPFEPELVAAAAAITEAEALAALDEVLASDLVRATDVPRRFRFRHPLVQHAVYDSVPGLLVVAAPHQRCAAALAERGAPSGRAGAGRSSSRKCRVTWRQPKCSPKRDIPRHTGRLPQQRAGSRQRFGSSPLVLRRRSAHSCCSLKQRRSRPRATLPRLMPSCSSAFGSRRTMRAA